MAYCPVCKAEWPEETSDCPICGHDLTVEQEQRWVFVGTIADKLSADFARETLKTYDIPAVIVSKSGFFGNIGLPLTSFYTGKVGLFEVSVPSDNVEEAIELLAMSLGDKWKQREE